MGHVLGNNISLQVDLTFHMYWAACIHHWATIWAHLTYPPPAVELKKMPHIHIDFIIHFFGFLNFASWSWDSGLTYDFGQVTDDVDCYLAYAYVTTEKKVYAFVFVFILKMLLIASLTLLIWLKWNFKEHKILIYLGKYCIDFGLWLIQLIKNLVAHWVVKFTPFIYLVICHIKKNYYLWDFT